MAWMLKGLVHGLAWSLATGAAVTLSWWGVHTVLAGTAYDPPRAVPIPGGIGTPGDTKPLSSSTHRPRPSPPPAPRTRPPQPPPPSHSAPPKEKPSRTPTPSANGADSDDGVVRAYDTPGGRVVLDISKTSASLVSATPKASWSMQVWKEPTWIRVEFSAGSDEVSVFCTWNGHQPQVQIVTY